MNVGPPAPAHGRRRLGVILCPAAVTYFKCAQNARFEFAFPFQIWCWNEAMYFFYESVFWSCAFITVADLTRSTVYCLYTDGVSSAT